MRIAIVHSYYSSTAPSGENLTVDRQVAALREQGHTVEVVAARTDSLQEHPRYRLETAARVAAGWGRFPLDELEQFSPDVVHVHNLFPNIGRKWLTSWRGPLVATLHNYRPLCSAGTLTRDGSPCTLCPDKGNFNALKHRCYRGSILATLPLVMAGHGAIQRNALLSRAQRVVLLSEAQKVVYERYGLAPDRMVILPNFTEDLKSIGGYREQNRRWLVAGRLSVEKGVLELLENWPRSVPIDVVGDGPQRDEVTQRLPHQGRLLGPLPREQLLEILPAYTGLAFPSRCLEGLPGIVLEALEAGVPVAALASNGMADLVDRLNVGIRVENDQGWTKAVTEVIQDREAFGRRARAAFEDFYSESAWVPGMLGIYEEAIHMGGQ